MTNGTLWIEITIAGCPYVLSVGLLVLAFLGIKDLGQWSVEKYLPYLSVVFVGTSYIFGIISHRVVPEIAASVLRPFRRIIQLQELKSPWSVEERTMQTLIIFQNGSQRLHRELDFQFSLVALLRSLLFSIPLLFFSFSVWLIQSNRSGVALCAALAVPFWCLSFLAYRKQWAQYVRFMTETSKFLDHPSRQKPLSR